ncbi:hypothetical protein ACJ41O_007182 [Fusarium nematophilum]
MGYFCLHCQDAYNQSWDTRPLQYQRREEQPPDAKSWYSLDRHALFSLSLVSRRFRDISQQVLYHEFVLGYGDSWISDLYSWNGRLASFMRTLSHRPDLARLVKVVYIHTFLLRKRNDDDRLLLKEAARGLGLDLPDAWRRRAPGTSIYGIFEIWDWPGVYKAFLLDYLDEGGGLDARQRRKLSEAFTQGPMPGNRWVNAELATLLIALVPNVEHISVQGDNLWPTWGFPESAFSALNISNLAAVKTLDLGVCGNPLIKLAAGLETLNLHEYAPGSPIPPMPRLKTLRVTKGSLDGNNLQELVFACTGGLRVFEYEAEHRGRSLPFTTRPHFQPSEAIGCLARHSDTLEVLHLDLTKQGHQVRRINPYLHLKEFTALKHLFLNGSTVFDDLSRETESRPNSQVLIRLLPTSIVSLSITRNRHGNSLNRALVALAEVTSREFPSLKWIRSGAARMMESAKRKRAAKACNYCRRRPAIAADRVDEILSRLETLESCLQHVMASRRGRSPDSHSSPYAIPRHAASTSRSGDTLVLTPGNETLDIRSPAEIPRFQASLSHFANSNAVNTTMDIPLSHSSTTGNLLRSTPAAALLGHYPPDLFLHIELRRPIPDALQLDPVPSSQIEMPTISQDETDPLVQNFFQLVHRFYPVLDQRTFHEIYGRVLKDGLRSDQASALVLIVLALGAVAAETPNLKEAAWHPGVGYFTPAIRLLLAESLRSFGGNPILPQALYLAALYYSYLSRPLLAWRLVHMASTDVQHYWIRSEKSLKDQSILRLFWAILVLECDILAEHHLPRSGIEKIVDKLPYPLTQSPPELYMHRWLADLSSRRLLNRIHYVLYAGAEPGTAHENPSDDTQTSLPTLAHELNHQLHAWYRLLPLSISPDLDSPASGIDDAVVIMRYHAAGDIIYRPFLIQACAPGVDPPPSVTMLENAQKCLFHCRGYLNAVEQAVRVPTASLENFLHGTMAVVLLLSFAAFSKIERLRVPDLEQLQDKGIRICERWVFPGSSIEQMVVILRALRAKCIDTD